MELTKEQQAIWDKPSLEESFLFLLVAGRLLDSGEWPAGETGSAPLALDQALPDTKPHQIRAGNAGEIEEPFAEQIVRL
jgi:hypothetical protein